MYLNMQIPFLGLWSQWNLPVGPLMNEGSSRVYPVCSHHTVKALCLQGPVYCGAAVPSMVSTMVRRMKTLALSKLPNSSVPQQQVQTVMRDTLLL